MANQQPKRKVCASERMADNKIGSPSTHTNSNADTSRFINSNAKDGSPDEIMSKNAFPHNEQARSKLDCPDKKELGVEKNQASLQDKANEGASKEQRLAASEKP